jgi:hypothetical protein
LIRTGDSGSDGDGDGDEDQSRLHDVTFVVQGKSIKAHRIILSMSRSTDVFKVMFKPGTSADASAGRLVGLQAVGC